MKKNLSTKTGRRNTWIFYSLLKQLPGYDPMYRDVIKEGIVDDFTFRSRSGNSTCSLSSLTDGEYSALIEELEAKIAKVFDEQKAIDKEVRRDLTHKIFTKLGELNVSTRNGYAEVNWHIKRLKGFGGRIIPEMATEELPGVLNAVRNYVDFYKRKQKEIDRLQMLN